jgi:cytochrome c oxidase subunit 2
MLVSIIPLLIGFILPFKLDASWKWNMTEGVTDISLEVFNLHMRIFWICVGIGVVVFSLMLWAIIFHRKSLGHQAATFHENIYVEICWTLIPFLILFAMSIPATRVLIKMEDTSHPDLTIKVVGYQWFWGYEYPEENLSYFSNLATPMEQIQNKAPKGEFYLAEVDHPLVVPINKKIRLLTTAADVQHSFWVPALGFKKDAIPGFINEAWTKINKPGIYRGRCAELCGFKHAYMPIELHAVSWEDYELWLKKMKLEQNKV